MLSAVEVEEMHPAPHGTVCQTAAGEPCSDVGLVSLSAETTPKISHKPEAKIDSGGRLIFRLAFSFALLILILVGLGWWVSWRIMGSDAQLETSLRSRTAKLQIIYEALSYSSENSRITMHVLLAGRATPELLARREANSRRIQELIAAFERQCDSHDEQQLLAAVKSQREKYVSHYERALKLLLEEQRRDRARSVMLSEATPALFAYHSAWEDLAGFELQQMEAAAQRATQRNTTTRHIGLTLQWLAVFLAAAIALFNTRHIARDMWLRSRMQDRVSRLNAELEHKVDKRTQELARRDAQLQESLAETQSYAREIEDVNELAKLLQSSLNLEEAQQQASRVLAKFFPGGAALLLNSSQNLLEVVLAWGATSAREGPFPPESCWGLRKGEAHLSGPHCSNPACNHYDAEKGGCHVCVPMMAQGGALGVLSIEDTSFCGGDRLSHRFQRKLKLAHTLAEQIALAFANLSLREKLKYQSVRDPLTGLFNRRHMEEILERELCRAARNNTPVSVLMIDIDQFKRFNDCYGHEAGDLALREFGVLLRLQVRGGDIACRYGGEEFLLIMGETDAPTARERAETLRQRVAELPIRYRGQMLRPITVSIGVATFPAQGDSAAQLVSSADAALYRAKREGRDRVFVAE